MDTAFRPAEAADIRPAFAMFRRAIYAHLHRTGLASAVEAADPPIDSAWLRQGDWINHFWTTAAENWVATNATGSVIGWALSVERDQHLELAFFFVDPDCAAHGVGKRLLDLAFASRSETQRTIMATLDPAALSLYLRTGLCLVTTSFDICVQGQARPLPPGLDLRPIRPDPADIQVICDIEAEVLHLRRPVDIAFLTGNRPGWIAWRNGKPIGYAFGAQPLAEDATDFSPSIGPAAALDDADLPGLLDCIINAAALDTPLYFGVPMANQRAIDHLLRLGGKIDPFYIAVLSTSTALRLDRYIHTEPSFII